ncbi:MAG: Mom family adenine methylcarbamoylation protein [Bellilinea sp.]
MKVIPITKEHAEKFVTQKHYSKRASVFWEAFGLVIDGRLEGVCVYGQPSPPIQKHAFADRDFRLYELCRLVIQTERKNAASILVGRSLRMLSKQPCAVVSYADTEWGHAGIIYQATNWVYTGATKSHDHAYLVDGVRTHPMTLRDKGITNPKEWAKANNVQTLPPMHKHRYFYFVGTKRQKAEMKVKLRYDPISEYPKLDKQMYDAGPRIEIVVDTNSATQYNSPTVIKEQTMEDQIVLEGTVSHDNQMVARITVGEDMTPEQTAPVVENCAPQIPVDKLVKIYVKIRDTLSERKREFDAVEKDLKGQMAMIATELKGRAQLEGVDGFKTEFGTVFLAETMKTSCADWAVFGEFLKTHDPLEFMEKRISSTAVKEYMKVNGGQLPPGVSVFREIEARVRRAGDK